jgi:hypothetical protein
LTTPPEEIVAVRSKNEFLEVRISLRCVKVTEIRGSCKLTTPIYRSRDLQDLKENYFLLYFVINI